MSKNKPLVSCVMVSRGALLPARWAIEGFLNQTYENRELIVVTSAARTSMGSYLDGLKNKLPPSAKIVFLRLFNAALTVGAMRNEAVKVSKGEYIATWDDDDLYGPDRLKHAMDALKETKADAFFLRNMKVWSIPDETCFITGNGFWPNTMVAKRSAMTKYPDVPKEEDLAQQANLVRNNNSVTRNFVDDYLYINNGANMSGNDHFRSLLRSAVKIEHNTGYAIHKVAGKTTHLYHLWAKKEMARTVRHH